MADVFEYTSILQDLCSACKRPSLKEPGALGDEGTLGGLGSARLGKARFTGSTVRRLTGSAVHRFTGSAVRRFTGLAVHRLAGSQVPRLTGSPVGRFSGSMVRRAGSAGSSLRFEPGPREKCPSLPVRTRVRRFGHRFAGSTYYDVFLHEIVDLNYCKVFLV